MQYPQLLTKVLGDRGSAQTRQRTKCTRVPMEARRSEGKIFFGSYASDAMLLRDKIEEKPRGELYIRGWPVNL
jgi:hypothetical protein